MASLFSPLPSVVRLLDAGAGAGALTLALVERCCSQAEKGAEKKRPDELVRAIDVTLYESDETTLNALLATLRQCERLCAEAGIRFVFTLRTTDFIREAVFLLANDLPGSRPPAFHAAMVNPPYRKIRADSPERLALRSVGIEASNLYAGFVALIQRFLSPGGQLVAITPRSFCNGPYFRPFREDFLAHMALRRLHVFESRSAIFQKDKVLQENLVFHAVKKEPQPREIIVSSSNGEPGGGIVESAVPFSEIVQSHHSERFIHIPASPFHAKAKTAMERLSTPLATLGLKVSTGRVVEFRHRNELRRELEPGTVPLVYPAHFNGGTVHWPQTAIRKPNAIQDTPQTRPSLMPPGVYLLTKRFTAKEERRRLVACLFDPAHVPEEQRTGYVGFENHLNYFHAHGHGLEQTLAAGLLAFLNSTMADQYFRRFSGHTQVNATDLRTLFYPTKETLQAIGRAVSSLPMEQNEIDLLVAEHLL